MITDTYYFSHSLKKTANDIIDGLEKTNIVILVGDAGSGKTALCKYMIQTKQFWKISSNVKYFNVESQEEFSKTYENYLLIIDSFYARIADGNYTIHRLVELSKLNKILFISRSIDTSVLPSYKLVSMPRFSNMEVRAMVAQFIEQKGIELSKAQMNQIIKLSNGSFLNAKLIVSLMQEDTLEKIFEDMRTISDIKFDSKTWSTLSFLIAQKLEHEGDFLRAKEYYCHAYNYLPNNSKELKFELLSNLANISTKLGEYMAAISYYKQALNYSKEAKKIIFIYNNIGSALQNVGNFVEAEVYFHKALYLLEDLPSYDESIIQLKISILTNLGACLRRTQQYESALQVYQHALSFENNDINSLVAVYHNVATTYVAIGEYDHALSFYKKVLELVKENEDVIAYDLDRLKREISRNIDFCVKNISE